MNEESLVHWGLPRQKQTNKQTGGLYDARCAQETKGRIAWTIVAYKKKTLFTSKMNLKRKKLVKWCLWSIALCGPENWTRRKLDLEIHGKLEI